MSESTVGSSVARPQIHRDQGRWEPIAGEPEANAPSRTPLLERLGQLLILILLIVGLPMAYQRAIDNGPDLAGFCDAGRYIVEHGTRDRFSTLARYWPSADVPWIAFAMLPIGLVAVLWYFVGCATWIGLLRTICNRILVGPNAAAKRHATLAAGLLAMPLVIDGMSMGSFHVMMVWLMILGLDRACRGRETSGGIFLGAAAWLKLLPMLGIGFLLYQRRWKGALIAVATVFLLDVVLSVAAFGPAGAWHEHVVWWQQGAAGTANRQLASFKSSDEDRLTNESVAVILRRMLTSMGSQPAAQSASEDAAVPLAVKHQQNIDFKARRRVQIADLSAGQLQIVFLAVMGVLALCVAIYCRPVQPQDWARQGPAKIAMMSLATIWFSPVVWSYHFVAAAPVMAILFLRGRYRWQWVVPVVAIWAGALGLLAIDAMRAAGVLLWMTLLMGAGLVVFPTEADTKAGNEHRTIEFDRAAAAA